MAVFSAPDPHDPSEHDAPRSSRRAAFVVGALLIVVVLAVAGWWVSRPAPAPGPASAPRATAPAPPVASPPPTAAKPPAAALPDTAPGRRPRARAAPKGVAPAPEPAAPAAPARELIVESDVDGALVFLDRKFLGNAPARTTEVAPGTHQVNVSAEGHEGVAQTIEVAESGPTSVTIRLKEVRLNESVAVVHKHAMGSCQGRLSATLDGFRYAPQKGNDGFTMPLAAVESFEINYLEKNLRLKRQGGKTWNFESPTGSPDPLFVFHREVEKARTKLAASR